MTSTKDVIHDVSYCRCENQMRRYDLAYSLVQIVTDKDAHVASRDERYILKVVGEFLCHRFILVDLCDRISNTSTFVSRWVLHRLHVT